MLLQGSEQRCGSCKQTLPVESFSPSYRGKSGTWCRTCHAGHARGERPIAAHLSQSCAWCQADYVPKRLKSGPRYCSKTCQRKARYEPDRLATQARALQKRCSYCDEQIPVERLRSGRVQFCSERHQVLARQERRRAERALGQSEKRCDWCSASLAGRKGNTKWCSPDCARSGHRDSRIQREFGITSVYYDALCSKQKNRCAICRTDDRGDKEWHIDHDHVTSQVRGLLCSRCNTGIGQLQDDPQIIRAALRYVEQHRQMVLI